MGPVRPSDPLDRTWILVSLGKGADPQMTRSNTNLIRSTLGSNRTSWQTNWRCRRLPSPAVPFSGRGCCLQIVPQLVPDLPDCLELVLVAGRRNAATLQQGRNRRRPVRRDAARPRLGHATDEQILEDRFGSHGHVLAPWSASSSPEAEQWHSQALVPPTVLCALANSSIKVVVALPRSRSPRPLVAIGCMVGIKASVLGVKVLAWESSSACKGGGGRARRVDWRSSSSPCWSSSSY